MGCKMSADDELGVLTSFTSTGLIHLLLSVAGYPERTDSETGAE